MPNDSIINQGGESDPLSLRLYTRRNRFVRNERRGAASVERMTQAVKIMQQGHPNARLRSAASTYNCMGLVFANRRTWIDPDQWEIVRDDDGYRKLDASEEPFPGDVVLYREGAELTHVAVITTVEPNLQQAAWAIEVISQWGMDGEYLHEMTDVPRLLGVPVEIWTERAKP
jgi:hypothetical protein